MNLSDIVAPDELLCRYLLSRSQFSPQKKRVKSSAFLPPPDLKLSVFRIIGLTEENIWEIGEEEVVQKQPTPKTLYGRAEIIAAIVQNVGLTIDPDNDPPRHANILGWPEEKSEKKLIALELSESAKLKLRS
jgi:hypothetical protein